VTSPDDSNTAGSGWRQLDTLRLVLSLIVVIAHANYVFITPLGYVVAFPVTEWLARFAVLAFFVLSGLVIGKSLAQRRDGFAAFMIRRVGRIYPPLIASFVLVLAIDHALRLAGIPTRALPNAGPMTSSFVYDLHSVALCLATFGFRGWLSSGANGALWSLVIEMRCYVIAGLLAQIVFARSWPARSACTAALAVAIGLLAAEHFDPIIALSYAAFLFGLLLSLAVKRIPPFLPTVRADISYSLYIVHQPVMLGFYFAFYQPAFPSLDRALALGAIAIATALLLSLLSARFIEPFRGRWLAAAFDRFAVSRRLPARREAVGTPI
jgi:peptidoglycan/LPS O-acetylase OafA/YrhL